MNELTSISTFRVNKDISQINTEIGDVRAATDEVARSKVKLLNFSFQMFSPRLVLRNLTEPSPTN